MRCSYVGYGSCRRLPIQDLNHRSTQRMLRPDGRQTRLQRRNHGGQSCQHAKGRGVVCDDVMGEDERKSREVLAVDGERVVREGVADL